MKKVIIAGGSGFLGKILADHFAAKEAEVIILSRSKPRINNQCIRWVKWDGINTGTWVKELDNADLLINLTGKSVDCRYTNQNKAAIINSRINSVLVLEEALALLKYPPPVWIQAGSATIYSASFDKPLTEESTEIDPTDFSPGVCVQWEEAFFIKKTNTRKILLRMGFVLGDGSALSAYKLLVKTGMGGVQGNGKQMMSWLHKDDLNSIIDFLFENKHLQGCFNLTAPNPVTNKVFMKTLREVYRPLIAYNQPAWLLEIAAFLLRIETELLLKSRYVVPHRLEEAGYHFIYPEIRNALLGLK